MQDMNELNIEDEDVLEEKVEENIEDEKSNECENIDTKKEKKIKVNKKIEKLEEENKSLVQEVASIKDTMLRQRAELENFKRRQQEERIKERKYASQNLVSDLINSVEFLVKACNMETSDATLKNFLYGFKMISNQILDVLKADGLKEIETLDKQFDPVYHHAVETVTLDDVEDQVIVEELQKGYMYKDRVLRPSMVKVNKK